MCGIAGIYAFNENGRNKLSSVLKCIPVLKKRGPDSDGSYFADHVGMVHTRLSIIDTSNNASQPFTDDSERYTLIFNGEFFNFLQFRKQLLSEGVSLRSDSDTEVLLHLLIREGGKAIEKINGFFAFAFYDKQENTLLLARDRFGIKPLFYHHGNDAFYYASELKALLNAGVKASPDLASLRAYFHLNYIPGIWTAYEGIKRLEPGTYLELKNGRVEETRYYQLPRSQSYTDYTTACSDLSQLLEDAVRLRLISDVPLGCFLSGGIDSSIIAALASKHQKRLKTFSIGFKDEPYFDETSFARIVAEKYKTDHTEFSLTTKDLLHSLDHVLDYLDEPFADSSAIAVYTLSKETAKHVTVALSGDGADELFAGYNKHAAELRARSAASIGKLIKSGLPLFDLLPSSRNSFAGNKFRQLRKFAEGAGMSRSERYWRWAGFQSEESNPVDSSTEYLSRKNELLQIADSDDFNNVLRTDVRMVLAGDMLTKVDSMSMANSLEVRTPFLDYRVADLAFSIPVHFKIDSKSRKKILRDTFGDLLSPALLNRRKQGFEVPLLKWFRTDLRSRLESEVFDLNKVKAQGILDPVKVESVRKELFSNNPGDAAAKTYAMLVFQNWYKKNFGQ